MNSRLRWRNILWAKALTVSYETGKDLLRVFSDLYLARKRQWFIYRLRRRKVW